MKKKTSLTILLLLISVKLLSSASVVFPFKVNLEEEKSLQWLGKAVSLYIKCGFELNYINTFRNEETDSILRSYNIKFPYNISKALLIKLSKEIGAERLIWGEISSSASSLTEGKKKIIIRTFVIDLKNFSQKYLPVIKGDPKDIFKMEQNLFESILKLYTEKDQPLFPDMEFDKSGYEMFVKAMLLTDYGERLSLLEKIEDKKYSKSDLLNFELAKAYYFTNSNDKAREYLAKINENSYLKGEKFFLEGILDYFDGHTDESLESFRKVLKTAIFKSDALSNYGMLLGLSHNYEEAIKYLLESLQMKKSKEAFVNTIFIYILDKKEENAKNILRSALIKYPYSKDFRNILKKFLANFSLSVEAANIFSRYIPGFNLKDTNYKINFKLLNPFIPSGKNSLNDNDISTEYNGANEEKDPLISELDKKLWKSPFSPDLYFQVSQILRKSKKFYSSLNYASCALFLRKDKEYFINILSLLKKLRREDDYKIIQKEALLYYPGKSELILLH